MKLALLGFIVVSFTALAAPKGEMRMNKNALIVLSSHGELGATGRKTGWYLAEASHVYYPLVAAGFKVDFASPKGGAAPLDPSSRKLEDPENKKFLEDKKIAAQLENTIPLSKIEPGKYSVIHFAGGHGTMWDFPNNPDLNRVAASIYEKGGIVSAVCHGPAALVDLKLSSGKYLIEGKDVNSFTNSEDKAAGLTEVVPFLLETRLKERGAKFHAGKDWENKVVVSERLITGQNPQSAASLGNKIVELSQKLL